MKSIKHFFELLPPISPVPSGVSSHIPERSDMNIKCVIFDIYGTMLISESGDIDSSHLSQNAALTALNESGVGLANVTSSVIAEKILRLYRQFIAEATVEMRANGISYPEIEIREIWKKIIAKLLRDKDIEPIPDAIDFSRLASIFEALNNPVWPMPSMLEVLKNLNGRNIPVGIISNAQFYTPMLMNYFLTGHPGNDETICFFDPELMMFSYREKRSKPDKTLFSKIAERCRNKYALQPEQVLFVGNDMYKDIWPAAQTGFRTALFAGDLRSLRMREDKAAIAGLKPDFTINRLEQIMEIVK